MRYQIEGADRTTGLELKMLFDAASADEAERVANERGLLVANVRAMSATDAPRDLDQRITLTVSSSGVVAFALSLVAMLFAAVPLTVFEALLMGGLALIFAVHAMLGIGLRQGAAYWIAAMIVAGVAIAMAGFRIHAASELLRNFKTAVEPTVTKVDSLENVKAPNPTRSIDTKNKGDVSYVDVPATGLIEVAGIRIQLQGIETKRATYDREHRAGETRESDVPMTLVSLSVTNVSKERKIAYRAWSEPDRIGISEAHPTLVDQAGNDYRQRPVTTTADFRVSGASKPMVDLYPGDSISDCIAFQNLVESATDITLQLPAKNVSASDKIIRFKLKRGTQFWR